MSPRLVYVMGPSGAGKDAVLAFARERIDGSRPIVFAHRYVTRTPDPRHPNEVSLGPGEWELRESSGLFTFRWQAWGARYGVGTEIRDWLRAGLSVVVSGSREHFAVEARLDASVQPVLVTAPAAERARRLRTRAREDEAAIAARLARGDELQPADPRLLTIDNGGSLEQAGSRLVSLLQEIASAP